MVANNANADTNELDELTLRRAQRGDTAACSALVIRYQGPVFALVGRMLGAGRSPEVEDLAQDTFLDVFRALARFQTLGPARLSTWILTIASRRSIDFLRKHKANADADPAVELVDARARTDEAIRRRMIREAIEREVGQLAPEYRAAFLLREFHELSYAEIAGALSIDIGTVKSRLARARQALRDALAEVRDA